MPKQITLDGIEASGINIYKENGTVRIEANYHVLAGTEIIKTLSRDIASVLTTEQIATVSNAFDAIFSRVEVLELS